MTMTWLGDWWRARLNHGFDFAWRFPTNFAGLEKLESKEGEKKCQDLSQESQPVLSFPASLLWEGSTGLPGPLNANTPKNTMTETTIGSAARRPEVVCRPVDEQRSPSKAMALQPAASRPVYDARVGLVVEAMKDAESAAEFRRYLSGAAGRKPPVMIGDPDRDSLELAWFACEATDEEWESYCQVLDGFPKLDGFIFKPVGGYCYSPPSAPRSIWPVVCGDGAAIDVGFVAGKGK